MPNLTPPNHHHHHYHHHHHHHKKGKEEHESEVPSISSSPNIDVPHSPTSSITNPTTTSTTNNNNIQTKMYPIELPSTPSSDSPPPTSPRDSIQSPPKLCLPSSAPSPSRSPYPIPPYRSSSPANVNDHHNANAKPLILDIGDPHHHHSTSIFTTTLSSIEPSPPHRLTSHAITSTLPPSTPILPTHRNTSNITNIHNIHNTFKDVETETDIITSNYSCMNPFPIRLTFAKSVSESTPKFHCQTPTFSNPLPSHPSSSLSPLEHVCVSHHHLPKQHQHPVSMEETKDSEQEGEDANSTISLSTPANRWRAMSQMAGPHQQDSTILDFSNRTDLTFESLQYGVPPSLAKQVLDLRCHEYGIHNMARRLETTRAPKDDDYISVSGTNFLFQSPSRSRIGFHNDQGPTNRILIFGRRCGSYEADLPAFLDVVERVFPKLLHISLGTNALEGDEEEEEDDDNNHNNHNHNHNKEEEDPYTIQTSLEMEEEDPEEDSVSIVSDQAIHHGRVFQRSEGIQLPTPPLPPDTPTQSESQSQTPSNNSSPTESSSHYHKQEAAEKEAMRMKRLYILFRLPDIRSINLEPVTDEERRMAHPNVPHGAKVPKEHWLTRAMKDWEDPPDPQGPALLHKVGSPNPHSKEDFTTWESSSSGGIECRFPAVHPPPPVTVSQSDPTTDTVSPSRGPSSLRKEPHHESSTRHRLLPSSSKFPKWNTHSKSDFFGRLGGNAPSSQKSQRIKLAVIRESHSSRKDPKSTSHSTHSEDETKDLHGPILSQEALVEAEVAYSQSSGNAPDIPMDSSIRKCSSSSNSNNNNSHNAMEDSTIHTTPILPSVAQTVSSTHPPTNGTRVTNRRPPTSPASILRPIPLTKAHKKRSKKRNGGSSTDHSSSQNSTWNRRWGRRGPRRRPVMPSNSMADEEDDVSEEDDITMDPNV